MESPNKSSSPLAENQSPPASASPSKRNDFQIIPISDPKKKSKNSIAQVPSEADVSYNGDREAEHEDLMREDKNLRTVLHRAALDHDKRIVKQLCQRAEKILDVRAYVNKKDKFGNSPLLSACVYNKINKETDEKLECLKTLLQYGAEPNEYNTTNLWSPLTWCAYYGDYDNTKVLLENGAQSFWPDKEGHFPLDHCGLQDDRGNKKETAKLLIDNLFELLIDYENKKHDKEILTKTFGRNVRFLQSPLLRTSLLYWVTYFNLNAREYFTRLLEMDGVYPDLPLKTIFGRNCYHASCASGNKEALNFLLNHKRRFYSMHQRFIRTKMYDATTGAVKGHTEKDEMLRVFAFSGTRNLKKTIYSEQFVIHAKETVAWILAFDYHIDRMVNLENEGERVKAPNYFQIQDIFGNTPLHFASFLGRAEIAQILLDNGANIEIENKDGWRCAELRQHKTIEQMYKDHMKKMYDESVVNIMSQKIEAGAAIKEISTTKSIQKKGSLQKLLTKSKRSAADNQLSSDPHTDLQNSLAKRSKMFLKRRKIPDVVLVFRTQINDDKATTKFIQNRVNFNISLLINKFDCYLSKDISDSVYYLMIKTNERDLDYQCLKYNIKMKLLNAYGYKLYDPTKKTDFEPFRSRQRAEITLTAINEVLNIQQLKDLKILQEIYPMHTVSGIERIKEIWLNSKWYWPQPLASFRDYLREGKHLNFTPITTLRTYFGESVAFYFAWTSFYTCYLLILAIPGLLVMIFILRDQSNSAFLLPAWVIYNSLCSTLVVEKWKRKAAEIATRWGTLDMLDRKVDQKVLRSEFIGNEIINQNTGALTKDNTKSQTSLYFMLSAPILILLMAAVVGTFLLTQSLIASQPGAIMSMIISTLNGIIIAVLNFVYQKLARYFVDKENHKYTYTYEKSLIFKGFLSLFFNSYLGVLYLIFIQNVELEKIYYNLISILITKQATSITTTAVIPWVLYKYKQRNYFKAVNLRGKEQSSQRRDSVAPDQEHKDGDVANSRDPLIEDKHAGKKNKKVAEQDHVVKRPVLDCKKGVPEIDKWDVTRVELNAMKSRNDDFNDDYGQMMIQYGYITMFASAFPIGPLISFISNILDTRAKLFAFLYVYHRPPIQKAAGIGNWQNVWEIMSIIGIFTNALILFFRSDTRFEVFEETMMNDIPGKNMYHDIRRLWVFLIIVYFILVLKLLARAFIQDKPEWVVNEEEKIKNQEKPEIDNDNNQASTLINLDRSHNKTDRKEPILKKNHSKNENILDDLKKSPKQSKRSPSKRFFESSPTKDIIDVKQEVKEVYHAVPKYGMPLSPSNIALHLNQGVKSLFFNAFTYIEKELSLKRLETFNSNIEELVIICQGCRKTRAILECIDCQEKHCAQCMRNIHDQTTRKTHKIAYLLKANDNSMNHQVISVSGTARKSVMQVQTKDGKSAKDQPPQQWVKLQNFEFPTYVHGDSYINIERIYKILYKIYVTENGVSEENTITDIKAALRFKTAHAEPQKFGNRFTEQQPGQEGSTAGKSPMKGFDGLAVHEEIGEIDHAWFDATKKFFGVSSFNTEEKLLINRVAFLTFKKRGAKANYNDFYRHIKTLQEGNLETKLMLFFDLIDEDEDGVVSLMQLGSFVDKSLFQDMNNDENYENILKSVLENKKSVNKKQFVNGMLNNKKGRQLLMSYFQIKEEKTLAVQVKS